MRDLSRNGISFSLCFQVLTQLVATAGVLTPAPTAGQVVPLYPDTLHLSVLLLLFIERIQGVQRLAVDVLT